MNEHGPKINRIIDSAEGVVTSQENSSKTVSSPITDNMEKQVDVEGLKNKIKVFKEQLGKFVEKSPDSSRALRDENKIKLNYINLSVKMRRLKKFNLK